MLATDQALYVGLSGTSGGGTDGDRTNFNKTFAAKTKKNIFSLVPEAEAADLSDRNVICWSISVDCRGTIYLAKLMLHHRFQLSHRQIRRFRLRQIIRRNSRFILMSVLTPKPGIPSNMIITPGPGAGQVTLRWTAPSGPVSDYSITYSNTSDTQKWGVVSTGNVTTYVISNLPPYKSFHFWINAVNGCMPGDALDPEVNMQVGTTAASSTITNTELFSRPAVQAESTNSTIPPPSPMPASGPADVVKVGVGGAILTIIGGALLLAL